MFKTAIRGDLFINVIEGRDLLDTDHSLTHFHKDLSDPWLEVLVGNEQVLCTTIASNTLNPKWNAQALMPICHSEDFFVVKVWDDDYIGWGFLGEAKVSLQPVEVSWERDEWVPLTKGKGEVHLKIKFNPFQSPFLKSPTGEPLNAPSLYFPPRKGGKLRLYQDAHVTSLPSLETSELFQSKPNMFQELANDLEKATKFIYIAGWSIWTELQMRRDGHKETFGELLKRRANEGVRVLILIWNEKFSSKLCFELVGTHDTKTVNFFKGTKVTVASVRRMPMDRSKVVENIVETIYVHHMKLIVMDNPETQLVGYVGGFDLTDGRWDTPEHPIWETLKTIHKNDFYNGFVTSVTAKTGPREPWHDLHTRVVGPATYDLLITFEERWRKQAPQLSNLLIPLTEEESIGSFRETKGRIWHTQVLRTSETSSSLFRENQGALTDIGIRQKDSSFHHGLVALIRSAKRFLYIETQYFIGSSPAWLSQSNTCAWNLLPIEIAEQIAHGIKSGKPIRAYIVIPLCPEGNVASKIGSSYMCDILHWQYLSIQMMYQQITRALKEIGKDDHPENYLVFLCLGKVDYSSEEDKGELVTRGEIAEFRRCLWLEHTGGLSEEDPAFADPSSEECISLLREKARQSLFDFMDDNVDKDVNFRFMKYPLKVEANGEVVPYPEVPKIPDFGLPVTGTRGYIPAKVTT